MKISRITETANSLFVDYWGEDWCIVDGPWYIVDGKNDAGWLL
ncbi:MAG TPA: hypothetical protein VHB48_03785 [Chitinophagaceae bacterium]|nr:hypothetical protein [Chitinophagaceae bacterium]